VRLFFISETTVSQLGRYHDIFNPVHCLLKPCRFLKLANTNPFFSTRFCRTIFFDLYYFNIERNVRKKTNRNYFPVDDNENNRSVYVVRTTYAERAFTRIYLMFTTTCCCRRVFYNMYTQIHISPRFEHAQLIRPVDVRRVVLTGLRSRRARPDGKL